MDRMIGPALIGVFFGMIVGSGLGWLLFNDPVTEPTVEGGPRETAAARSRRGADERSFETSTEPGPEATKEVTRQSLPQARRMLDALPDIEPAVGQGTLGGRILDRDRNPVGGVLIRARWQKPSHERTQRARGRGAPNLLTLEERIKAAVEEYHEEAGRVREAETGPNGEYSFTDLREGEYRLEAFLEGWEFTARGRSHRVPTGTTFDFQATRLTTIMVDVRLPDGSQPTKAVISCKKKTSNSTRTVTQPWKAAEGSISLPPGRTLLTAQYGPKENELVSKEESVYIDVDEPMSETLLLELKPRLGIRGVVKLPEGELLEDARVQLTRIQDGAVANPEDLKNAELTDRVRSGDPEYAFEDLAPGRYLIGCVRGRRTGIACHETVEVTDRMEVVDLVLPSLDPNEALAVTLISDHSKVIDGASFRVKSVSGSGNSSTRSASVVEKDGQYWVLMPDAYFQPWEDGASFSLVAQAEECGSRTVELRQGQKELTIRFGEAAFLDVEVAGIQGSGYEGKVTVSLTSPDERHRQHSSSKVQEGKATLGPVEAGSYELLLSINERGRLSFHQGAPVQRIPVTVVGGRNSFSMSLPSLYTLKISFSREVNGSVGLTSLDDTSSHSWAEIDDDGTAVFGGLAPGEYSVNHYGGEEYSVMRVQVPTAGTIPFEPQTLNAFLVNITDPQGDIAKSGLQEGDLILGIGDEIFEGFEKMQAQLQLAKTQESVEVRIRRGGSERTMTVEGRLLGKRWRTMGGSLSPVNRESY